MRQTNIFVYMETLCIGTAVLHQIAHGFELILINGSVVFINDSGYSAHIKGYWVSWIRGVIGVLIFIIFIVLAYYNKDMRVSQNRKKVCNISVTNLCELN